MSIATKLHILLALLLSIAVARGQETAADADAAPPEDAAAQSESASSDGELAQTGAGQVKTLSGMSILGNEEAPKSLVIVPWKSSELGDGISVNDVIDERARPVDKEVFLREVRYYQLRSGTAD